MTDKKPQPNPIEKAIGDRAKTTKDIPKIVDNPKFQKLAQEATGERVTSQEFTEEYQTEPTPESNSRSNLGEPTPVEIADLTALNQSTEERLQDQYPEDPPKIVTPKTPIPASPPDLQPVTKTCSLESQPPQRVDESDVIIRTQLPEVIEETLNSEEAAPAITKARNALDAMTKETLPGTIEEDISSMGDLTNLNLRPLPAEDVELTALRDYIFSQSFTPSGVAFQIVSLCSQPLVTTSTTNWDFKDRASIPDLVYALLRQPEYLEGIYPSLKIVMSDNVGNAIWSAGIATTIAFFDMVRTLPTLKEMENRNSS